MSPVTSITKPGNNVVIYHHQYLTHVHVTPLFEYFEQQFSNLWVIRGIWPRNGIKPLIEESLH